MKPLLFTLYTLFFILIVAPLWILHHLAIGLTLATGMLLSVALEWVSDNFSEL